MNIIEILNQTRQIPGSAAKAAFLKANRSDLLDEIITDAMDTSVTYGVTSKDILVSDVADPVSLDAANYDGFRKHLSALVQRALTGNAALEALGLYIGNFDEPSRTLLKQILDRNLGLGISWKTYRSEVMDITEKFEVALAQHLEKVNNVNPIDGTYYASRKCDGVRCVAIVDCDEGTVEFRSRQNKEYVTLENLKSAALRFCKGLSGIWVLDGELCKVNEKGDEDFQEIMKEIRRKDYVIEDCCYQVFDILTYDEFCEGKSKDILSKRFERLNQLHAKYIEEPHEKCWIKPLWQERLTSQADFDRWAGYVEAGNWEGFMIRKDVPYQSGRTKDLLKVKKFFDDEYVVKGIETGTMTTALPGQGNVSFEGVTRLIIEHKGNEVGVGAGLSREQRIEWMKDPSQIVGKTITVKYFEATTDKNGKESLRFPTLKVVHGEQRDT